MWILILTLIMESGSGSTYPSAVTAVPGFSSEAACLAAANAWTRAMPARRYAYDRRYALCAKA